MMQPKQHASQQMKKSQTFLPVPGTRCSARALLDGMWRLVNYLPRECPGLWERHGNLAGKIYWNCAEWFLDNRPLLLVHFRRP